MKNLLKKQILVLVLSAVIFPVFSEINILVEGSGDFYIPLQTASDKKSYGKIKPSVGGGGKFEIRPFQEMGIFMGVDYISLQSADVSPYNSLSATAGLGIRWPFLDRFTANGNVYGGVFSTSHTMSTKEKFTNSGVTFGGDAGVSFMITPVISVNGSVGYRYNYHADFPMQNLKASVGVSLNLTEALAHRDKVTCEMTRLDPVFPVLYSWYNDNSFGEVEVFNGENQTITRVNVYFYMEQYMRQPKLCGEIKKLKKNQSEKVELTSFFNERILELTEKTDATATIILEYYRYSKKERIEIPVTIPVYNRNSMSWDDDRRASVFVSARDANALSFAKQVAAAVRSNISPSKNENMQYAAALYEALSLWGMNYVVDPSSAYANNIGTTSIDFLQFPHQSLAYKGGDCDDLSILYCSLLESLGIESAFITVPGHIYAAFDTGLTEEDAKSKFKADDVIYYEGRAWMPVEITLTKDGFEKARRYGINEWNKYAKTGEGMIYPMHDSWTIYNPVTPPANGEDIFLTNRTQILNAFLRVRDSL